MKILNRIKAYYVAFEFLLTVGIDIILMYIFNNKHRLVRRYWAKLQSFLIGYSITIKGDIDKEAKLLIINHQSILDIVVLEDIHPLDLAWVAKKEIGDIPFFGHILKAPKMIAIDREDRKSIVRLLKDVKDRIKNNRIIAIFPEGTRGDGKDLLEFKDGAKILAEKLKLKVQPVVIAGSRDILNSQDMLVSSGEVRVSFLKSIDDFSDKEWYIKCKKSMQNELFILRKEMSKK